MSRTTRLLAVAIVIAFILQIVGATPALAATYTGPTNFSTVGAKGAPIQVVFANIDGDVNGNVDMVVLNNNSGGANDVAGNFTVYLGNGTGGFGAGTNFNVATPASNKKSTPSSIAVGVFRTGQKPDLVIGDNANTTQLDFCTNNSTSGSPSFSCATIDTGVSPSWVAAGHFTDSGCLDIAAADGGNNIHIYRGQCDGTFAAPVNAAVGANTSQFAVADFNTDGFDDLIAVTATPAVVTLSNKATAGGVAQFNAAATVAGTIASPAFVVTGDIKIDGKPDAVAISNTTGGNNVSVLINNGSGALSVSTNLALAITPSSAAIGDIDNDSQGDLIVSDSASAAIELLQGTDAAGSTFADFGFSPLTPAAAPVYVTEADIDNDGAVDIASVGTANVSVFINDPFVTAGAGVGGQEGKTTVDSTPNVALKNILGNFTRDGITAPGSFTVKVTAWGDGTPASPITCTTGALPPANDQCLLANDTVLTNQINIYTGHIYAQSQNEGNGGIPYQVTMTVALTAKPNKVKTINGTMNIADAPLHANPPATPAISATSANGLTFGTNIATAVVVALFSDEDPNATPSKFNFAGTAGTINWGDATIVPLDSPNVSIVDTGTVDGSGFKIFAVKSFHTFAASPAGGTVSTTIFDKGGSSVSTTAFISSFAQVTGKTVAGTEGVALGNPQLATFIGNAVHAYTATADFGGGPAAATVNNLGGNNFEVKADHTYAEPGSYPIAIVVNDGTEGSSVGTTATANVADAALTVVAVGAPINANEGNSTGVVVVGKFDDGNPGAPIADFTTVNIHWGDGNTTAGTVTQPGGVGTTFFITGSHTYSAAGPFNVTFDVFDVDSPNPGDPGRITGGAGATINVADAALAHSTTGAAITGVEGATINGAPVTIATFTDGNPLATTAHFTTAPGAVTIHWGDAACTPNPACTTSVGTVAGPVGGPFTVTGTHTYPEPGVYTVTYDVIDKDSPNPGDPGRIIGGPGPTATITDAPLTPVAVSNLSQVEGNVTFTNVIVGKFNDGNLTAPIGDFTTVNVHWGDGNTTAGTVTQPGGVGTTFFITGTHTYASAEEATYNVTFDVFDVDSPAPGDPGRITGGTGPTITITDAPLTAVAVPALSNVEGDGLFTNVTVGSFTDAYANAPIGDFAGGVTIHWGDATSSPGTITQPGGVGTAFVITGTHTYTNTEETNVYNITYDVADVGGSTLTGAAGAQVKFTDAPLTVGAAPAPLATTEGLPLNNVAVGTFTDGYLAAPLSDFAAGTVIHWGDGNSSAGTVTQPGGVGTAFVVNGTHTYAEKGVFNITFDVADVGGSTLTGAAGTSATIADAALTAGAPPANLNGIEGNAVTGPVATFTDANPIAPLADFPPANVTIHWGDGNTSTGTVTQPGGVGTTFVITGTHTYAEPGVYNVTFDVFDVDSPNVGDPGRITGGAGNTITITDGALTVVATAGVPGVEGNPLNAVVANFHDQNLTAPIADFTTVNIHWGDGNTTGGVVASLGGGDYSITGAHTYAEKGVFNVTFDVFDVDSPNVGDPGRITGGAGATVTVADAALGMGAAINTAGGQNVPINGGAAFVIANFFDCNPAAPLADFNTPTIHWGDGAQSNGTIAAVGTSANAACPGGTAANFTISAPGPAPNGTHTYANNNTYNITIDVADVDGSSISGGAAGTIIVAPGTVVQTCTGQPYETGCTPAFPGPGTFVETGSNFVNGIIVFSFEDSNPGATAATFAGATINWGDGTAPSAAVVNLVGVSPCTVYPFNGATNCSHFTVSGTHVYSFLGSYNVTSSIGLQVTFNVATIAASLVNAQISPPSAQIHAGSTVDLLVTLTPTTQAGYPNPVTLSCSGLGPGMTCTFDPSATVPDVNVTRQVHVVVHTTANIATNAAPLLPQRNGPAQLALLLPALFGTFGMLLLPGSRKDRKRALLWFGAALLLFVLLLAGCGGGGTLGGGGGGGGGNGTPAGVYDVTVNVNVAGITSPIAHIQVLQ